MYVQVILRTNKNTLCTKTTITPYGHDIHGPCLFILANNNYI